MTQMRNNYIDERMTFFAMDIVKYPIGRVVTDTDGEKCIITNKTINTLEVAINAKSIEGVNVKQWFAMYDFHKRFK